MDPWYQQAIAQSRADMDRRGLLAPPDTRTLPGAVQQQFGLLADVDRPMMWPSPDRAVGGGPDWSSWTAPEWMYEGAKAVALPGHVMRGGEWSPEDVTNMALTVGGSAGAASMAGGVPKGALGMNVWHGSPHKYGPEDVANSLDHIGKGEGAQAYGWGRYDAESRDVAKQYQRDVKDMGEVRRINDELKRLAVIMSKDSPGGYRQFRTDAGRDAARRYDELMDNRSAVLQAPGSLYKLDIPDEDVARYMDWDKPLSEQSESVRKALRGLWFMEGADDALTGETMYSSLVNRLGGEYPGATKGYPPPDGFDPKREASMALREAGIPGIKYLDGGSRAAGEGSSNYVTWDPDVLARTKMLQRDDEVFSSGTPAGLLVPRQEQVPPWMRPEWGGT